VRIRAGGDQQMVVPTATSHPSMKLAWEAPGLLVGVIACGFQGTAGCWAEITRPRQVPFRFAPATGRALRCWKTHTL